MSQIDDCQIQNPAYSFARVYLRDGTEQVASLFLLPNRTYSLPRSVSLRNLFAYATDQMQRIYAF